ncbi:hypothetical protein [Nonomuraea zeae]|nr:hypothetical protein [Nonomuraea zeae]
MASGIDPGTLGLMPDDSAGAEIPGRRRLEPGGRAAEAAKRGTAAS